MKKILVLGASGLLGSKILMSDFFLHDITFFHGFTQEVNANFKKFDILDRHNFFSKVKEIDPDVIINLISLTDVDYCEMHPNEAYLRNVKSVNNIVDFIKRYKKEIRLVHISTDQVYDGFGPHLEPAISLKNYYAYSKYCAELIACSIDNYIILRTNFFGKSNHKVRISFSDWLFNSIEEKKEIKVFNDVFFSPLSMDFLCLMIARVTKSNITGTYNLGSREGLSKAIFAYSFAEALGLPTDMMKPISISDISFLKAYRPRDMRMDCSCFEKKFEITLPTLQSEILSVSKEY